ncbi:MAG: DUF4167 domain-containing protein, partial [Rhizomicrobium sp.]
MKNTRRPQRSFGQGQRPAKSQPADNGRRSDNDQELWQRRRQHYLTLAESTGAGDRVDRENAWQHAEHFHRLIAAAAASRRDANVPAAVTPNP